MTERWVVNASPLIALAHAGGLELLQRLPTQLLIPEAVVDEVLAGPEDPAHRALAGGWGSRWPVTPPERIVEWGLGRGESAVLALALELSATAVIDDRAARRCAHVLGVPVIGTLGVIVRAKRRALIAEAAPLIRSVLAAGLFCDEEMIATLLTAVDEPWP